MRGVRWGGWGWLLAASVMIAASLGGSAETHAVAAPLKLGLMMNFSQGATGRAFERQRAFELAIKHVNAGGGVLGQPVMAATADTARDPLAAVAAARRLIEVEGVHAIVGPASSAVALAVAQQVTGPAGIPTISPSATSPELTVAADGDYLFRTALSDTAQGPVLARVTRERGFDNVGLLYRDDAWGRGLAGTFAGAWDGAVTAVAFEPGQTGFAAELPRSAAAGAQALVVVAGEQETVAILRGAIKRGLYRRFIFGDASKSPCVALEVGAEHLHGMYGTAGAAAPESATAAAWRAAYVAEHGTPPVFAYVRETYDAAIALALAAQAAGSTRGDAIRDRLRDVGGAPGVTVNAGAEGVAAALRILAEGGEVNYEGAAATLDWDRHGDLRRGHIGVWRFTRDGRIEDLEAVPFIHGVDMSKPKPTDR